MRCAQLSLSVAILLAACSGRPGQTPPETAQGGAPDAHPVDTVANDGPTTPARDEAGSGITEQTVHAHTNRLIHESSPYLLQHAHNPVDWHAWGAEAFELARTEEKPIFLSIGYSTCHWCHVMERESFENEALAAYMNAHFVCVKVDREERPDVDQVYMAAVQSMTGGHGGWPLSVFLTPDLEPFYGGTYFPPEDRFGRAGFRTVLERLTQLWETDRDKLREGARSAVRHLADASGAQGGGTLDGSTLRRCVEQYEAAFDALHGGFGDAPKFPRSFSLSFLLLQDLRGRGAKSKEMALATLRALRLGGIHDHLGGGFHRYSTDREWLVPHFEKMLYDQSFLARAYLDGFEVTGDASLAATARDTLDYVLRDLRDPAGGFLSAEDADSEGVEGRFYVWSRKEILDVLGPGEGTLFADTYGCTEAGNFLEEASGRRTGENIPHLIAPPQDASIAKRLLAARDALLAVRGKRVRPHLDDKVLTDWNGMAISAFARAGAVLGEPRYVKAADEAADFVLSTMRTDAGLLHRFRAGQAGIPAFLDDYAFLCQGLLDLYECTFDTRRLESARELAREMVRRFADPEGGGLHFTAHGAERLVTRPKELYDGATPSGNSEAALALIRIGRITQDADLEAAGRRVLSDWSGTIDRYPMGFPRALTALDFAVGPTREIVVSGAPDDPATRALLAEIRSHFLPDALVLLNVPGEAGDALRRLVPFVAAQTPVDDRPAAYVCTDYACERPVTSPEELRALLTER